MTTSAQQTALEKPVVPVAYFVEFLFESATVRMCNFNHTIPWGGYDWLGVGQIGKVSEIEESDSMEAKPLEFTLTAAELSWVALAVGPVDEYRGKAAKMYRCPLDENYRLVDTPERCWTGVMDYMTMGIENDEGAIILKCETSAFGLKRRSTARRNHAQQTRKYPGDTSFRFLVGLISQPQLWLTKLFQQI